MRCQHSDKTGQTHTKKTHKVQGEKKKTALHKHISLPPPSRQRSLNHQVTYLICSSGLCVCYGEQGYNWGWVFVSCNALLDKVVKAFGKECDWCRLCVWIPCKPAAQDGWFQHLFLVKITAEYRLTLSWLVFPPLRLIVSCSFKCYSWNLRSQLLQMSSIKWQMSQ